MRIPSLFKFLILISAMVTINSSLVSCSRSGNKSDAKTTIALPQNAPFTNDIVGHITINATGPGIPNTILWEWDANCHCPQNITLNPPPFIELPVPSGPARLLQVLVAYSPANGQQGVSIVKYGDVVVDLKPGINNVGIPVTSVASGLGTFAQFKGRILTSPGNGPSGIMAMKYQPPVANRPAMTIERSPIYNGWFEGMALGGIDLSYVLEQSNQTLFSSVTLAASGFVLVNGASAANNTRATYYSPSAIYYRQIGANQFESKSSSSVHVGYFGSGVTTEKICKIQTPAAGDSLPDVYYSASAAASLLYKSSLNAVAASYAVIVGGSQASTAACADSNEFNNYITIHPEELKNSVDSTVGFRGPFALRKGLHGYEILSGVYNSGLQQMNVSWKYLPGAQSSIAGASVYYKLSQGSSWSDAPCMGLQQMGYTYAGDTTSENFTLNGIPANTNVNTRICPYFGPKIYTRRSYSGDLNSDSSGSTQGMYAYYGSRHDGSITFAQLSINIASTAINGKYVTAYKRMTSITSPTVVVVSGAIAAGTYDVGDEVMWHVTAASGAGCNSLQVGQYGFTRVASAPVGSSTMTISEPIPMSNTANLANPYRNSSADMCVVQLVRVPHFIDVYINAPTNSIYVPNFDPIEAIGGIMAMRVDGLMYQAAGASLSVASAGFTGAQSVLISGSSQGMPSGMPNMFPYGFGNGGGSAAGANGGGGGANLGAGGQGGAASNQGFGSNIVCSDCSTNQKLTMGGGGGYAGGGGAIAGNGGGIMLIHARNIASTSGTTLFRANGGTAQGAGGGGSGGGGGGSFELHAKNMMYNVGGSTSGGQGGNNTYGGGGGGAGIIKVKYCFADSLLNFTSAGGVAGLGGTTTAGTGSTPTLYQDSNMCSN